MATFILVINLMMPITKEAKEKHEILLKLLSSSMDSLELQSATSSVMSGMVIFNENYDFAFLRKKDWEYVRNKKHDSGTPKIDEFETKSFLTTVETIPSLFNDDITD